MSELAASTPRYRVGIAVEPKKVQTFLKTSLIDHANKHNIDLVQINPEKPLTEQGPFHCIIHKLHDQPWTQQLRQFQSEHPNIPIIDPPESVARLRNRDTMLDSVTQLKLQNDAVVVTGPNQLVVNSQKEALDLNDKSLLRFPIIAKPLDSFGSAGCHELRLVVDREGLNALSSYPVVLQEFVNHGGFVFKIYVAGSHVTCVRRRSLPDITEEELKEGVVRFSRVSNLKGSRDEDEDGVEMPPEGLVSELGRALREALGLNLFNVDVIRDGADPRRYLVIDINYFPGYAKLPSYEPFFTDFLLDVVQLETA